MVRPMIPHWKVTKIQLNSFHYDLENFLWFVNDSLQHDKDNYLWYVKNSLH